MRPKNIDTQRLSQGAWGDPTYFVVKRYAIISTVKFELPYTYGPAVYLIEFSAKDLECPSSDPIAVYHYAGIRRFMWHDKFWNEVNLDYREAIKTAIKLLHTCHAQAESNNLRTLLELLQVYCSTTVSGRTDKICCRAMHEII